MLRTIIPLSMAAACGMVFAATQEIVIEAVDANGVAVSEVVCDIVNRGGTWRVVTPAVAQITAAGDWLQVKCAKGLDLAGASTSIDTNQLQPRRPAGGGFARELPGTPPAARVRVVLRDLTGAAPKSGAPTQTVLSAPIAPIALANALPVFATKSPAPPEAAPTVVAEAPRIAVAAVPDPASEPAPPPAPVPVMVRAEPQTAAPSIIEAPALPAAVQVAAVQVAAVQPAVPATPPIAIAIANTLPPAPAPTAPQVAATPPRDFYDVKAVPFIAGEGRAAYMNFLAYPLPRAFAISKAGGWGFGVRGSDPGKLALDNCERRAGPCEIYAVDRRVVWAGSSP